MKNYYHILGIKPDASSEDIKAAYRKLTQKFHPDKNGGDKFFEEHFKQILEAYEVLSVRDRRELFDGHLISLKSISQTQNLHEELKVKERDLAKQETDLRKKVQDAEVEKAGLQRKLYEQFEKEKEQLQDQFSHEKDELLRRIGEQTIIHAKKSSGKRLYQMAAGFGLLMACMAWAFALQSGNKKDLLASKVPESQTDSLTKTPATLTSQSGTTSQSKNSTPSQPVVNPQYPYQNPYPANRNSTANLVPQGKNQQASADASDRRYMITNAQVDLLESQPNATRDPSGNYQSQRVLVKVPGEQKVEVLAELSQSGYYYVSFGGRAGYIHQEYLRTQ